MTRRQLGVTAIWAVAVSLMIGLSMASLPAAAEDAPAKKTRKESYNRLPTHFGKVVDEKQREAIYDIQKEFGPKIKAIREQLAALMKERDEKIDAVLTPEQRKEIEQLKAEAKAKRKKSADEKKDSTKSTEAKTQ